MSAVLSDDHACAHIAPRYTVAVRSLCEFTARAGDLDLRFTPAPSGQEGTAGHQLVVGRRGAHYEREIPLEGCHGLLRVRGRADGYDPQINQLEEIKTYRGELDGVRDNQRGLHRAQARVYAHLLCQARGLAQVQVALVYFHIDTGKETVLSETCTAQALQADFQRLCAIYQDWAIQETAHRQRRDAGLDALRFPHAAFRAGQRELAVAAYRAARDGRCLMAQAPTGIGKTVGTLFPLLKAMPSEGLDRLVFLAAKRTGRALALDALAQIDVPAEHVAAGGVSAASGVSDAEASQQTDGKAGAAPAGRPARLLRVLALQARDDACVHPGKACHGDDCPLARGFYDRLPAARAAALREPGRLDADALGRHAAAHDVCPYYLAQELGRWCDVVVGDYNYYFDSSAMLYALAQAEGWRVGLLVDEAHNLVERGRAMYSGALSLAALRAARPHAKPTARRAMDGLARAWGAFNRVQEATFQAYDLIPPGVLASLQRTVAAIGEDLGGSARPAQETLLQFYFDALHFLRLAEQFGSHAMFDATLQAPSSGRQGPSSTLCVRNVVPAPYLEERFAAAHVAVLFSGTLSPAGFYADMLGLPEDTNVIDVAGPFRAEQLQVRVARHVSTRWRDRAASLAPIADLIARQFAERPGNYLAFLSSFDYLRQLAEQLQVRHPRLPLWCQSPGMDAAGQAAFLARFDPDGQGVGLAVLGGAFSEGVDLPGSRLIGAFVATLGLPQVNPVNERMRQVMTQRFGEAHGYDYTYLYPGLRKVVQAAGRVIRTESDQGVLHLIDDRYRQPRVRGLLPSWWRLEA